MSKRSVAFVLAALSACSTLAYAHFAPSPGKGGRFASALPAGVATVPAVPPASGPAPDPTPATMATVPPPAADPPATSPMTALSAPVPPAPAGEVLPQAKQLAAAIATRLVTYDPAASPDQVVAPVTADAARRIALADAARPLHHPGKWSRGTVVYPQLGGFRAERTSVMVVVRQEVGTGEEVELTETRTLDIRLARIGGVWVFEELASAGGVPAIRPAALSPLAAAVVDDPRIELPDSARWDIYRGNVAPALLRAMADLAGRTPYAVTVISSGHPHNVFATSRQSNHTRGRAVDVYRIGGASVVDDRARGSATFRMARWLLQRGGLSELGSPWRLGPGSFTDTVHQDHLHIAVRTG